MNIWWAYFIVLLIYRILTGKSKHVEDTRELNIEKVKEKKANVVSNGRAVLSNGESRKTVHQENGDGSSGDEIVKDYVIVNGDKNRNSKTNGKINFFQGLGIGFLSYWLWVMAYLVKDIGGKEE